ncbi:MAG: universal stress protein [Vicinamibacterales bacterium]
MLSIRTVLCPVDFSPASSRQVELAANLCRAFQARLVLHHNLTELSSRAAVGWMWAADHPVSDEASAARMHELVARASAAGIPVDAQITHGVPVQAVLTMSQVVDADLLVLTTHGAADDDHPSVTDRVLEDSDRSLLALHDIRDEAATLRFASAGAPDQHVLVPTDFTREARPAMAFAFDLARRLPVELHLLHVRAGGGRGGDASRDLDAMAALVPPDLGSRVRLHVEAGDPADAIATAASRIDAACIVMGAHTRVPWRRWFSRDTSKGVLHRARCPVWYVPAVAEAHARAADTNGQAETATT